MRPVIFAVAGTGVIALLAYVSLDNRMYALIGAVAVLALGLLALDPALLPVAAAPGMFLLQRAGSLSVSDLILFVSAVVALPLVRPSQSPVLRTLLWTVVAYQALLIPTLISNPYRANLIEWGHELFLVGGALIIGWVIGNAGYGRLAVGLYVVPCCVLAVLVVISAVGGGFHLAGFWIYQKNAIGDLFAFAAVIGYARPAWLRWRPAAGTLVTLLCSAGALAIVSRQAIVSIAAAVAVLAIRKVANRRSRIVLLAMIPAIAIAYNITADQLQSDNKFNSAYQRLQWYGDSLDVWRQARWLGVGLRWWYTNRFSVNFQPPNAEFEMLTSAGIVGVAAFIVTFVVALRALWRMDPLYGVLPFTILVVRFVQGQLDLYWVATQSSLPWLIVGICLGVQSLMRVRGSAAQPESGTVERSDLTAPRSRNPTHALAAPSDR